MPAADSDDVLAAHEHSVNNRAEIEASDRCACFSCCRTFRPATVIAWRKEGPSRSADTARCPHCGMDAVLGSASGLPLTEAFLDRMRGHWFRR